MTRLAALLLLGVLAAAGCADGVGEKAKEKDPPVRGAGTVEERFQGIPQEGNALGDPDAPWTLIEFVDMQCPFCAQFDRVVLPALLDRMVRTGRLRLELRPVAFLGPQSPTAAAATTAASLQDLMWQYADLFYRNQGAENSGYVTPDFLERIATAVPGLDVEEWRTSSNSPELVEILQADARAARTAGVTGTPGFRLGRTGQVPEPFNSPVGDREGFLRDLGKAMR